MCSINHFNYNVGPPTSGASIQLVINQLIVSLNCVAETSRIDTSWGYALLLYILPSFVVLSFCRFIIRVPCRVFDGVIVCLSRLSSWTLASAGETLRQRLPASTSSWKRYVDIRSPCSMTGKGTLASGALWSMAEKGTLVSVALCSVLGKAVSSFFGSRITRKPYSWEDCCEILGSYVCVLRGCVGVCATYSPRNGSIVLRTGAVAFCCRVNVA